MISIFASTFFAKIRSVSGGGALQYPITWGCAPVLGGFWRENSGNGVCSFKKISGIKGLIFAKYLGNVHLEFGIIANSPIVFSARRKSHFLGLGLKSRQNCGIGS